MEAGKEFGIRKPLGGRAVFINHLEACFPTIITDYCPGHVRRRHGGIPRRISGGDAQLCNVTFNIAGSFEGNQIAEWYRSPVELGWAKNIKFNHDFIGREAPSNPKSPIRSGSCARWCGMPMTLSMSTPRCSASERPYDYMEMPRDQRGFHVCRQSHEGWQGGRRLDLARIQLLFPRMLSLCTLDVACCALGTEVVAWGTGQPAKGNPRQSCAGPIQDRQPQTRRS